jgi:hypothetical protein
MKIDISKLPLSRLFIHIHENLHILAFVLLTKDKFKDFSYEMSDEGAYIVSKKNYCLTLISHIIISIFPIIINIIGLILISLYSTLLIYMAMTQNINVLMLIIILIVFPFIVFITYFKIYNILGSLHDYKHIYEMIFNKDKIFF